MENRKLDFFLLSNGRVATHAMWRYLDSHPEISLPYYLDTDLALREDRSHDLRGMYRANSHCGLMLHDQGLALHPEIQHQVRDLVSPKLMVQMVRNPMKMIVALYNHRIHRSLVAENVPHPGPINEFIERLLTTPYRGFHHTGARYYDHFDQVVIVDFDDMRPNRVAETMSMLFNRLSVTEDHAPEMFGISQQDALSSILRGFFGTIEVENLAMSLAMEYEGDETHSREEGWVPIARFDLSQQEMPLPIQNRALICCVRLESGGTMDDALLDVVESDDFLTEVAMPFLQKFVSQATDLEQRYAGEKLSELPPDLQEKYADYLRQDVQALFKVAPELEARWQF